MYFVYVCLLMCARVCPWRPGEGVGSLELEFAGVGEELHVDSGNQMWAL